MISKTIFALALSMGLGLQAAPHANLTDRQVQRRVVEELSKRGEFKNIDVKVDDAIVTLAGNVELYIDKVNAEKRARKVKTVDGVRNHIAVEGKQIADGELREALANKLRYDRVGYGIVFNNLTVEVENGTVKVGGQVRDYPDRDSALAIVQTASGVKDVVDDIDVAPASMADDSLRVQLAKAIYGQTALQKYAVDPQAPIRIVVENGRVELAGVVLNESDKQIAYLQANSVPGVFEVKNNLVVAAQ